jgi:hypothetical protein
MFLSVGDEKNVFNGEEKINPDALEAGPYPKEFLFQMC